MCDYGQYDFNGSHACGIFADCTLLTIEDCVFYHNGWSIPLDDRNLATTAGGADFYKQAIYVDSHRLDVLALVARRNVIIDPSAGGLSMRGNHLVHHNVMIDCPDPEIKGGGSGSDTESPNGNIQKSYCQLVMGGADINNANPRMQGFQTSNGKPDPDAYCKNSLYINNPGYGQVNNQWLRIANSVPAQPSFTAFSGNRAYGFAPPATRFSAAPNSGGSAAAISYTDIDNLLSVTSPMTNAQVYAAIGYGNKAAMVADMIADPTQGWAYRLLLAAAIGFNFSFDFTYS